MCVSRTCILDTKISVILLYSSEIPKLSIYILYTASVTTIHYGYLCNNVVYVDRLIKQLVHTATSISKYS